MVWPVPHPRISTLLNLTFLQLCRPFNWICKFWHPSNIFYLLAFGQLWGPQNSTSLDWMVPLFFTKVGQWKTFQIPKPAMIVMLWSESMGREKWLQLRSTICWQCLLRQLTCWYFENGVWFQFNEHCATDMTRRSFNWIGRILFIYLLLKSPNLQAFKVGDRLDVKLTEVSGFLTFLFASSF